MAGPARRTTLIGERTMTLKAVPFFTQLSDRELDVVRAVSVEKNYPRSAVVLTEGEMGDSLYMIQTGKVKVFIGDEDWARDHPEDPRPRRTSSARCR